MQWFLRMSRQHSRMRAMRLFEGQGKSKGSSSRGEQGMRLEEASYLVLEKVMRYHEHTTPPQQMELMVATAQTDMGWEQGW